MRENEKNRIFGTYTPGSPDAKRTPEYRQFHTADEMYAYIAVNSPNRKVVWEDPSEYDALVREGMRKAKCGFYLEAYNLLNGAVQLNPVAVDARLEHAMASVFMGFPQDAKAALNALFPYIVEETDMWLFYKYYGYTEKVCGNYLSAAGCFAHANSFENGNRGAWDIAGAEVSLARTVEWTAVNVDLAKANPKYVLKVADIPYIEPDGLLERKISYGDTVIRRRENLSAIIPGGGKSVTVDKSLFERFEEKEIISAQFADVSEALMYAAMDANGLPVGMADAAGYVRALEHGRGLEQLGEFKRALKHYAKFEYLNPVRVDMRLSCAICNIQLEKYDEARGEFDGMFKYISNNSYAWRFYALMSHIEFALGNKLNSAACAFLGLMFDDNIYIRDRLKLLRESGGVDLDVVGKNPVLALENGGIPVITPDGLKQRRADCGILTR